MLVEPLESGFSSTAFGLDRPAGILSALLACVGFRLLRFHLGLAPLAETPALDRLDIDEPAIIGSLVMLIRWRIPTSSSDH